MSLERVIAVDAMTAERGVKPLVEAVFESLDDYHDLKVILVGDKDELILSSLSHPRIEVEHATEVIRSGDSALKARRKKNSSTWVTAKVVKEGKAYAGVSFGNTIGVAIAIAKNMERLDYVKMVPLATKLPCVKNGSMGYSIFLDVGGTNSDSCTPEVLLQFGILAKYYALHEGIENPLVGLLSNGVEKIKGTKVLRAADKLYDYYSSFDDSFNYVSFVEGGNLFAGKSSKPDIVVTDGFTGNICLKIMEGEARLFKKLLEKSFKHNLRSLAAGGLYTLSGAKKRLKDMANPDEYNGAYFLGLKQPFIKGHGDSNKDAIKSAIGSAYRSLSHSYGNEIVKALEKANSLVR